MDLSAITTTNIALAVAVLIIVGIGIWLFVSKRRTDRLRTQFGSAEYARAVKEGGGQRKAEAVPMFGVEDANHL